MDWGKLIGGVAPTLATILGGPLAGGAVSVLSNAVLGHKDGTEGEIYEAIVGPDGKLDSEAVVKVKEAELTASTEEARIHAGDRSSARDMHVKMKDATTTVLSYAVFLGFFGLCYLILFVDLPTNNSELLYLIVGYVAGDFKTVMNFWFGSSKGSRVKDVMKYAPTNFGAIGNLFKKKR